MNSIKTILVAILLGSIFFLSPNSNSRGELLTKSALGHRLFFDPILSHQGRTSCSSCHLPQKAYTDGYRKAFNDYGEQLATNTSSLLNLQDYPYLSWKDTTITSFHEQMDRPLFSEYPLEMGIHLKDSIGLKKTLKKYRSSLEYHYEKANIHSVKSALAHYLQLLQSRNSQYDQWMLGVDCEGEEERIGQGIYTFQKLGCSNCHGGRDFNKPKNKGLYDMVKTRIPSLRNVVLTAPYYHDGSVFYLDEALQQHPQWNGLYSPPTSEEKGKLVNFLYSLTDTSYLGRSLFQDPFLID